MVATCSTCTHWQLRDSSGRPTSLASHGFGQCGLLNTPWTTYPPQHTCPKHKEASQEVVAARMKWLDKK